MATSQEEKDKEMERRTAIIGTIPNSRAKEREMWDEKGNLIDPDQIEAEKRMRGIAQGKITPEIDDYHDQAFGEKMLNIKRSPTPGVSKADLADTPAPSKDEKEAAKAENAAPVSLSGLEHPTPAIPKTDNAVGAEPEKVPDKTSEKAK